MGHFTNKRVLVTGAGGSIGSQLCRQILEQRPDELVMLNLTESGLYNTTKELSRINTGIELTPVLGSVADYSLVSDVLQGIDVVIHAGAHKHVPLCETNVIEAVKNNVLGTEMLLEAVEFTESVQQFIFVSSDKAVRPASVMGATKRAGEMLVQRSAKRCVDKDFIVVRFGNVLDSSGSVLPLWREQLARGEPVTVTDVRCTRYFMSIPEAVSLIMETAAMSMQHGTFIFDMGEPKSIYELACSLVQNMGGDPDYSVKLIGLRDGEKLTEELDYGGPRYPTQHPKIFEVDDPTAFNSTKFEHLRREVQQRFANRVREVLMLLVQ